MLSYLEPYCSIDRSRTVSFEESRPWGTTLLGPLPSPALVDDGPADPLPSLAPVPHLRAAPIPLPPLPPLPLAPAPLAGPNTPLTLSPDLSPAASPILRPPPLVDVPELRRSSRPSNAPDRLNLYVSPPSPSPDPAAPTLDPIILLSNAIAQVHLCQTENGGLGSASVADPLTVSQAFRSPAAPKWKAAMQAELDSMRKHEVYTLVPRPTDRKVISSK